MLKTIYINGKTNDVYDDVYFIPDENETVTEKPKYKTIKKNFRFSFVPSGEKVSIEKTIKITESDSK